MTEEMEENNMYATLKRIYTNTKNEMYLTNAVAKGWITEEQKADIIESVV